MELSGVKVGVNNVRTFETGRINKIYVAHMNVGMAKCDQNSSIQ